MDDIPFSTEELKQIRDALATKGVVNVELLAYVANLAVSIILSKLIAEREASGK